MVSRLRSLVSRLHEDTRGAMAVEKILLLALISIPLIIVLWNFRETIKGWFADKSGQLQQ